MENSGRTNVLHEDTVLAGSMSRVAKNFFRVLLLLGASSAALAQSAPQAPTPQAMKASPPGASASPTTPPPQASTDPAPFTPNAPTATAAPAPANAPTLFLPAATRPAPKPFAGTHEPWPAAIIPALEVQVGFSTLSRVSSSNNRVLYNGLNTHVTKQYTNRIGGTLEVGYLRASNVFHTGQSNSVLTYLLGPVFHPYRGDGFVTSLHALGGGARVAGVIALTQTPGQYLKGVVDDRAWALGAAVERWFFSDLLALHVDVDTLHTTFFNNAAKPHGEYDLRATWGISYNLGPRRRGGKFRNMAGRPIE